MQRLSWILIIIIIMMAAACSSGTGDEQAAAGPTAAPVADEPAATATVAPVVVEPAATATVESATVAPAVVEPDTEIFEPILVVDHADQERRELPISVYLTAADFGELRALVLDLDPEADPSVIDAADPSTSFFVAAGYYCGTGGRVVETSANTVATYFTSIVLCDRAQPALSIFQLDRANVGPSFDVTAQTESQDADQAQLVVRVENWLVVD